LHESKPIAKTKANIIGLIFTDIFMIKLKYKKTLCQCASTLSKPQNENC